MRLSLPSLVSLAVVAYAVANVVHEGLGHGVACVALGGVPKALNAVYFDCGEERLGGLAVRLIAAAGTGATALLAWAAWALQRKATGNARWFWWLLGTVCTQQAAGYLLFSGLLGVGDWAKVVDGLPAGVFLRLTLALVGATAYLGVVRGSLERLVPLLGSGVDRQQRANRLLLVSYFTGGALYVAAGVLNPESPMLVLISAAAASLGGTSGLTWMGSLLDRPLFAPRGGEPVELRASPAWLVAAVVTGAVFVGVLGRSVVFVK